MGGIGAHRRLPRLLITALATFAIVLGASVVPGCGDQGSSTGDTKTDYVGLWVDKAPFGVEDEGGGRWARIDRKGDGYELTWLVSRGDPPTLQLTEQDDGSLRPVVGADGQMIGSGPVALSALVLNDQGQIEVRAPEGAWDDDPSDDTAVLVLARATEEEYAKVQAIWAVEDDFYDALTTLQEAIDTWASKHDWKAPAADEVRPGGAIDDQLRATGKTWPTLASGEQLLPGKGRGEYVYTADAHAFTLEGMSPTGQSHRDVGGLVRDPVTPRRVRQSPGHRRPAAAARPPRSHGGHHDRALHPARDGRRLDRAGQDAGLARGRDRRRQGVEQARQGARRGGRRDRGEGGLRRRARRRDRGDDEPRRHRLPHQRRRVRRRGQQVRPLRHDLERHARHRPRPADQALRSDPRERPRRAWGRCSSGAPSSSATRCRWGARTASTPSPSPSA